MKTAIRVRQDGAGRFGRDVHAAAGGVQTLQPRTTVSADGEERFDIVGYEIDADAVAAAILSRLFAGGTLLAPLMLVAAPSAG